MNFIRLFFTKEQPKLLGRWKMTYENIHLDRKVYLANHDHCGSCGIIKLEEKKRVLMKKRNNIIICMRRFQCFYYFFILIFDNFSVINFKCSFMLRDI